VRLTTAAAITTKRARAIIATPTLRSELPPLNTRLPSPER